MSQARKSFQLIEYDDGTLTCTLTTYEAEAVTRSEVIDTSTLPGRLVSEFFGAEGEGPVEEEGLTGPLPTEETTDGGEE